MVSRLKWVGVFLISFVFINVFAAPSVKFQKRKISLAGKSLNVEIAESDAQHEQGLMFRKKLGPNEGMLFIFKDEQIRYFWMKNTLINLSIGYFDKNKKLIDIVEMKATTSVMEQELPNYPSSGPAMYALEMNEGWFKKNKVVVGSVFEFKK